MTAEKRYHEFLQRHGIGSFPACEPMLRGETLVITSRITGEQIELPADRRALLDIRRMLEKQYDSFRRARRK